MKQTVYIVDDEPMAIHYLKTLLQETDLDVEVIGVASNGVKAISEIADLKPDFVFVDISMPIMDGLEMSEKVLANNPSQKIFMLTAYRDFDYAKKSVQIGVTDYILKNELSKNLLKQIIQKNTADLEIEKRQRHIIMEMNIRKFFLWDKSGGGEWIYQDKPLQRYLLFYITYRPQIILKHEDNRDSGHVDCYEIERSVSDDSLTCRAFAEIAKGEYVGIFFAQSGVQCLEGKCNETADKIMKYFKGFHQQYVCLISSSVNKFSVLQKTYKQLHRKLPTLFNQNETIFYEKNMLEKNDSISKEALQESCSEWKKQFLQENNREADFLLKEFLMQLRKLQSVWDYTSYIEDIFYHIINQVREYKLDESLYILCDVYTNIEALEKDILGIQDLFFKFVKDRRDHKYSRHIILAQEFVYKNYEKDISVVDIAEAAGISQGHLRRCFKQEMNLNVVNFLTEYRLNCAKKLMKTGTLNIDDIWKKCGFASAQYFSYLFKKKEGSTPREYLNQNN